MISSTNELQPVKATINVVIDEAFKKTAITKIESIVRRSSPTKDELVTLENTMTSLRDKIKQAKQISEAKCDDNVKLFGLKRQQILPIKSLVNVIRCSSITKQEVLTLLTSENESDIKQRILPEAIPETKQLTVCIYTSY